MTRARGEITERQWREATKRLDAADKRDKAFVPAWVRWAHDAESGGQDGKAGMRRAGFVYRESQGCWSAWAWTPRARSRRRTFTTMPAAKAYVVAWLRKNAKGGKR